MRGADQVAPSLALPDPLGKSVAVPFGLRLGTKRGKSFGMRRVFGKVPAFIPVCLQIMQHVRIAGSGHQLVTPRRIMKIGAGMPSNSISA